MTTSAVSTPLSQQLLKLRLLIVKLTVMLIALTKRTGSFVRVYCKHQFMGKRHEEDAVMWDLAVSQGFRGTDAKVLGFPRDSVEETGIRGYDDKRRGFEGTDGDSGLRC